MSSSHAIYRPRRTSSPAIFRESPLRMRRPSPRRSFDVHWWSRDVARSRNLPSKEEEKTDVDSARRRLTRRTYLIEATLKDLKMDARPIEEEEGRMPVVDTVVIGGVGKNKAVFSRHLSDPFKWAMAPEVGGGERRRLSRSPERTARLSKQMSNRYTNRHQRDLLRMKFKLVGKLIIACHQIADEHKFGNQRYEDLFPYVRTLHFHDYDDSDAYSNVVTFNPNKYKANKQLRIPEEARRILSKPPLERTKTELLFAKTALLSLKSYAEYPVRMQMKIVAAGTYERYESKRMILRQGHAPTSFYFILSGSVVVMVQETDFPQSIPIGYRGKGDTFGELAMLGKTRQSSIISKETIELLSLNVEDFENIFMFGGIKNLTDPDHFEFLRSLEMLKDWPVEKLVNLASSNEAVFMYFPRGEILVKDSHFLETLVIVKSGSVRVLKKLKQYQPYTQDSKKANKEREEEKEKEKEMMGRRQHIRKIAEDLDSNRSVLDSESETEVDLDPKFIQVQTLRKGQVFGLANLILEDQPSLCAVSDGAECIMLNKQFYFRNAPDKLIAMLKLTCVPYPTENELHEKLEKSLSWRKYKDKILAKTMNDISTFRIRNNSSSQRHLRTHSAFSNLGI